MSDLMLPPWVPVASFSRRYIDSTSVSVGEYSGLKVTASKGGDRWGASLEFTPQGYSSAGTALQTRTVQQFLARMRGRQNRAYILDPSRRRFGTFPTSELITNNTFSQGLTGWSVGSSNLVLSVSDRRLRSTRADISSAHTIRATLAATVANAPYAFRVLALGGRGPVDWAIQVGTTPGQAQMGSSPVSAAPVLLTLTVTDPNTVMHASIIDGPTGRTTFDYFEFPYTSFARCMLTDTGVNALLWSDKASNAAWFKDNVTAADSASLTPNGSTTQASQLTENTANTTHAVTQLIATTTAAQDVCFAVALKAGSRSFAQIIMSTGANFCFSSFNLTDGAVGENGAGGTFVNPRTPIAMSLGNGWWYLSIICQKPAGITTLTANVRMAINNTGAGSTYTGNGTGTMLMWRATIAASGVPVRLIETTTAGTAGATPTGSIITVKGAPASTADLLLPGDQFEVITSRGSELKIATAALSSNAAGQAHLQFEPPLRGSVSEAAPIIVHEPFGYYMVPEQGLAWARDPGVIRASLEIEEAS